MSLHVDPNNLERAAEAIREIQSSPHAKLIYQGIIEKEKAAGFSNQAALEREKTEYLKVKSEEARKTMTHEKEQKKQQELYRDEVTRRRFTDQLKEKEKQQDIINKKNEESIQRQEEIRLQSMSKQMKEQYKLEEKKAELLGKAKALAYRENFDLRMQEVVKKEEQRRQTAKELASITFESFAHGVEYIHNNKSFALSIALYTSLISAAFFLSRSSIHLGITFLQQRLGQPTLIRETSRPTIRNFMKQSRFRLFDRFISSDKRQLKIFQDIILPIHLEHSLQSFSFSIINKKRNLVPLRNMLIYGPPGTGKTLFAKKLAYSSGMDFAIMAGSDIAPLKENGVEQLNKVFDWANKSSRGMILFVDEGDAFFRSREDHGMSENVRNCINTFLYRTGTPSEKVMFIVATNYPQVIDKALNDRVDNYIFFPLPNKDERFRLLNLFFSKYFGTHFTFLQQLHNIWKRPSSLIYPPKMIKQAIDINEEFMHEIALQTDGFSGREIEKFVVACHNSAFFQKDPSIDRATISGVLHNTIAEHVTKTSWKKSQ